MKYILFTIALAGVFPAAFFMAYNRKLMWLAAFLMIATVLVFNPTAINFMSHETYRGTSRGMEVSAIHLCAFALLLGILIRKGRLTLVPDGGIWLFGLYFLFGMLSISNSANVLFSFFEIWKMMMLYVLFIAVWNYLELTDDIDVFLYGMAVVVLFNFGVVVWDYFHRIYQARGVFPHQNSMGMYMALAGNLFLSRFLNGERGKGRLLFGAAFAVASVSLVLTYSRGAITCYPIGCGLTLGVSLLAGFDTRKLIVTLGMGIAGIMVAALFVPRVIERFKDAPEKSKLTRIELAASALYMMDDNVFGIGINNWGIKINPPYPYARPNRRDYGYGDEDSDGIVETVYLLVGAECGYGGLAVLLIWFAYYWLLSMRLLKRLARSPQFYFAVGAFGGLPANYMQSILEWVLKQQINFMQLMLVFAVLGYLNMRCRKERMQLLTQKEVPV